MTDLEKSILSTVVYYDAIDLPLTSREIFEHLMLPLSLRGSVATEAIPSFVAGRPSIAARDSREIATSPFDKLRAPRNDMMKYIMDALDSENLKKIIDQKNGFYFLKGRGGIYEERIERQKIADQKWKKTLKIAKWFQAVPFIKMICAGGSLAFNHTDKSSDLDIFVAARAGRIWTVRFLLSVLAAMMGVKRFGNSQNICNKICFNHFITDKSLNLESHSIYTANIFGRLVPIYDTELYGLFCEKNDWINSYLPNFAGKNKKSQRTMKNSWFKVFGKMGEPVFQGKIGDIFEKFFKKYQLKRIKKGMQDIGAGRIIAEDGQLAFHPHSPERGIIDKYNEKMKELGFLELANEQDSGLAKE